MWMTRTFKSDGHDVLSEFCSKPDFPGVELCCRHDVLSINCPGLPSPLNLIIGDTMTRRIGAASQINLIDGFSVAPRASVSLAVMASQSRRQQEASADLAKRHGLEFTLILTTSSDGNNDDDGRTDGSNSKLRVQSTACAPGGKVPGLF